jgi:prepilin-type N-terminal cleavage/methylation domain-containing protein
LTSTSTYCNYNVILEIAVISNKKSRENRKAFTLVELLVVIGIIALLLVLASASISGIKGSSDFNNSLTQINAALEQARTYAIANSTYVFVGFTEVDGTQSTQNNPQTAGAGRVVVVTMASQDGTLGYDATLNTGTTAWSTSWGSNYNSGSNLVLVGRPLYLNNLHMATTLFPTAASGGMSGRQTLVSPTGNLTTPNAKKELLIGAAYWATAANAICPFTFPLGTAITAGAGAVNGQYNFNCVLYFDPTGAARLPDNSMSQTAGQSPLPGELDPYIELDLQPTHGNAVPAPPATTITGNIAAIQIDGMTGQARIYRP